MLKKEMIPRLEMLGATMLMAGSGVLIKIADLPSTSMAWFRSIIPGFILFWLLYKKGKKVFRGMNKSVLGASILNGIRLFFFFTGYRYTSVGNGVIILYTWPIFVSVLSMAKGREKTTAPVFFYLSAAFIGIMLVYLDSEFSLTNRDFIGMSSMLLSSFLYALTVVVFKGQFHSYSRMEIIFYQNMIPALFFTPFFFLHRPWPDTAQLSIAVSYGFFVGLIAFLLFFSALKKITASKTAHLSYMEVIGALILSVIILGETLTWNKVTGGILILGSILMAERKQLNITQPRHNTPDTT